YEVIYPIEINSRKFIEYQTALIAVLLIHYPCDRSNIKRKNSSVSLCLLRVISHADYLGLIGVVDIKGKIISRKNVVEFFRRQFAEANLCTCNLPFQLLLSII